MTDSRRAVVSATVIALKLLAFAVILKPVLFRHASKVVTVFAQPPAGGTHATRAYTYFTGFHVLDFSDLKSSLLIGVVFYLAALWIQFVAAGRRGSVRAPERPPVA